MKPPRGMKLTIDRQTGQMYVVVSWWLVLWLRIKARFMRGNERQNMSQKTIKPLYNMWAILDTLNRYGSLTEGSLYTLLSSSYSREVVSEAIDDCLMNGFVACLNSEYPPCYQITMTGKRRLDQAVSVEM